MQEAFTETPESDSASIGSDAPHRHTARILQLLTTGAGVTALLAAFGLLADIAQIVTLPAAAAVTALGISVTVLAMIFFSFLTSGKLRSSRPRKCIAAASALAGLAVALAPFFFREADPHQPEPAGAAPAAAGQGSVPPTENAQASAPSTVQRGRSSEIFAEFDLSMKVGHGYDLDLIPGDQATKNSGWSGKDASAKSRDIYLSDADTSLYAIPHTDGRPENLVRLVRPEDPPGTCRGLPDGVGGGGILAVEDLRAGDRICALSYGNRWAMLRIDRLPSLADRRLDTHVWLLEE